MMDLTGDGYRLRDIGRQGYAVVDARSGRSFLQASGEGEGVAELPWEMEVGGYAASSDAQFLLVLFAVDPIAADGRPI